VWLCDFIKLKFLIVPILKSANQFYKIRLSVSQVHFKLKIKRRGDFFHLEVLSGNVEYSIFKIIRKLDVAHIKSLAWDRSSNASIPISIVERSRDLMIVVITGKVM